MTSVFLAHVTGSGTLLMMCFNHRLFLTALPLLVLASCYRSERSVPSYDTALVVLGNQPLDDKTPTIDTVRRVDAAVNYATNHPRCVLIMTGGPTAGRVSEASMMAELAVGRGWKRADIILEEAAHSTRGNAALTAPIVEQLGVTNIFVVSKRVHLDVAMIRFREYPVFKLAQPLACEVSDPEIIRQMEDYLRTHKNPQVEQRLEALRRGIHGID